MSTPLTAALPAPKPILPMLRAIDAGTLTAAAAFEAFADHISALEPAVKAFAHLDVGAARAGRAALEGKPLNGLPVGIKDLFDTADMPTSYGTPIHAGTRPKADAGIVVMSRRAGGSLIGKTTTTPFAHLDPTATENPRAPGHTPGGSSAGSAAAVAAGMVAFAIGSQTGGSVIRPASYCGVAGYKPSYRLLPITGAKAFSWLLDTTGIFAPTVDDAAFYAEAMTGRRLRTDRAAPSAPRIGILRVPDWSLASAAMVDAVTKAMKAAEKAGAKLVDLGGNGALQAAWEQHHLIQGFEACLALGSEFERNHGDLPPLLRAELTEAQSITPEAYDAARATAQRARKASRKLFEDVDVVLMPSAPGAAPETLASTGRALFNRLWTLTGDPAVTVPGFSDGKGHPLGVQVIGGFGEDAKTLAAAAFLERAIAVA